MTGHAEKHLAKFASNGEIPCPHPGCMKARIVVPGIMALKSHVMRVHGVALRYKRRKQNSLGGGISLRRMASIQMDL